MLLWLTSHGGRTGLNDQRDEVSHLFDCCTLVFSLLIQVPLQSFEIEGEVTDVTPKLRQMAMKDRYCIQKTFFAKFS